MPIENRRGIGCGVSRRKRLLAETSPAFVPYIPDGEDAEVPLHAMDLDERLGSFPGLRVQLLDLIREVPPDLWDKRATHPEYANYTPEIMIRHIMMHDYLHMYRIEELWLTKTEYLPSR